MSAAALMRLRNAITGSRRKRIGKQAIAFPLDHLVALASPGLQARPIQHRDPAAAVADVAGESPAHRMPAYRASRLEGDNCSTDQLLCTKEVAMNITLSLAPLVSLLAGILILIVPRLLNYIVAAYLIVVGVLGLFGDIRLK